MVECGLELGAGGGEWGAGDDLLEGLLADVAGEHLWPAGEHAGVGVSVGEDREFAVGALSAEGVDVWLLSAGATADAADVIDAGALDPESVQLGERAGDLLLVGEADQAGSDRDSVRGGERDVCECASVCGGCAADDLGVLGGILGVPGARRARRRGGGTPAIAGR